VWGQASWDEPLLFDYKGKRRVGILIPKEELNAQTHLPEKARRKGGPDLPELSELEVVRHFLRLSQDEATV